MKRQNEKNNKMKKKQGLKPLQLMMINLIMKKLMNMANPDSTAGF